MEQCKYITNDKELKTPRFLQVPYALLKNTELSSNAKLLYALMIDQTRWAYKKQSVKDGEKICITYPQDKLCAELSLTKSTLQRTIKELVNADLLVKQVNHGGRNIYYVLDAMDIIQ